MIGHHPYDAHGGEDPVANIRKGHFPYGMGAGGIPKGPWYIIWSHLPHSLKKAFIDTFREGAGDPSCRLSPQKWLELLRLYHKELGFGYHQNELRPAAPKSPKYRGRQTLQPPFPA